MAIRLCNFLTWRCYYSVHRSIKFQSFCCTFMNIMWQVTENKTAARILTEGSVKYAEPFGNDRSGVFIDIPLVSLM